MEIKEYILSKVEEHPTDLTEHVARHFKISKQAVHKHLKTLVDEGKLERIGRTRGARYQLVITGFSRTPRSVYRVWEDLHSHTSPISLRIGKGTPDETEVWKNSVEPLLAKSTPESALRKAEYCFTELFNNVLDHSGAFSAHIRVQQTDHFITCSVEDDGIGIYQKLGNALKIKDLREVVLELTKGKLTTDPEHHTGEGLFFSSRASEHFVLSANGLSFLKTEQDWGLSQIVLPIREFDRGTYVGFRVDQTSTTSLKDLFSEYTSGNDFSFSKTEILVRLSAFSEDVLLSRSQAKRVLTGLGKFKKVVFDFSGVESVGQGFIDEIFRVFAKGHPEIELIPRNANEDVTFMLRHCGVV